LACPPLLPFLTLTPGRRGRWAVSSQPDAQVKADRGIVTVTRPLRRAGQGDISSRGPDGYRGIGTGTRPLRRAGHKGTPFLETLGWLSRDRNLTSPSSESGSQGDPFLETLGGQNPPSPCSQGEGPNRKAYSRLDGAPYATAQAVVHGVPVKTGVKVGGEAPGYDSEVRDPLGPLPSSVSSSQPKANAPAKTNRRRDLVGPESFPCHGSPGLVASGAKPTSP
jgi:hypothetical protein